MAKKNESENIYHSVISFKIDAQNVGDPPLSYPKTWQRFYNYDMNMLSPENTHLIRLDGRLGYAQIRMETGEDVELIGRLKNSKERERARV